MARLARALEARDLPVDSVLEAILEAAGPPARPPKRAASASRGGVSSTNRRLEPARAAPRNQRARRRSDLRMRDQGGHAFTVSASENLTRAEAGDHSPHCAAAAMRAFDLELHHMREGLGKLNPQVDTNEPHLRGNESRALSSLG